MGTRYCSYCGCSGHTKAKCPTRKERVEKLRESNPDHYSVRYFDTEERQRKESRERAVRNRTCSFCSRSDHNRRTCPTLKAAKSACYEANLEFRKDTLAYLRDYGIAPGALFAISTTDWRDYERVEKLEKYIVTSVDWTVLNFNYHSSWDASGALRVKSLKDGASRYFKILSAEAMKSSLDKLHTNGNISVPVVIGAAPSGPTPPLGWLQSKPKTADFSKWFKDKKWDAWNFKNSHHFEDARETNAWKEFTNESE